MYSVSSMLNLMVCHTRRLQHFRSSSSCGNALAPLQKYTALDQHFPLRIMSLRIIINCSLRLKIIQVTVALTRLISGAENVNLLIIY